MSTPGPVGVPVRDAATVVLLRNAVAEGVAAEGLEVWLLTRVTQMAFAAGMSVFPGGRVDPADADIPLPGAVAAETAARFRCDETEARALLGAAVREIFEETGVLLTQPAPDGIELTASRTDLEAGRIDFATLLSEHGLAVDASGLRPWGRWITPPGESRRYDTRFFIAALPPGAEPANVTSESSRGEWVAVGAALEQAQRGERRLLPPTMATLAALVRFGDVAEALAAADERDLAPVQPNIRLDSEGSVVAELPDGTSFTLPKSMFS